MVLRKVWLAIALMAGSHHAPALAGELDQAPGWYYLWALCIQEPSTTQERFLCNQPSEDEQFQVLAVSSVFRVDTDDEAERTIFTGEVSRRFGFETTVVDVGPFDPFQEAEAAIVSALKASRRIQDGLLAVTGVPLAPERLDDEPTVEERRAEPAPLPPVMDSFKGGGATLWRDDAARTCGLRLPDGMQILPDQVTDPWGEEGEGCPRELADGSGIFRFDVPRNGMICGDTGVCTELYDSAGHWLGVIEETPYPVFSIDLLRDWGIIATGMWNYRLYSIPERRFLFERWPGPAPANESRVLIKGAAIIDDRPAVMIDREYRNALPDMGLFWLDTMKFEPSPSRVEAAAIGMAERVCLDPAMVADANREGPCTKALVALRSAGLQDTLLAARVWLALGHIWAEDGASEVAIRHYQNAAAFAQASAIEQGEIFDELAELEPGSAGFCALSPAAQLAIAAANLRQSWLAVDALGTTLAAGFAPGHDEEPSADDLASLNFGAQRMMALLGDLFPQFNRPMDVPVLIDRLATKSIPAFDGRSAQEPQTAFMEALLANALGNDAVTMQLIEALGQLEAATHVGGEAPSEGGPVEAIGRFTAAHSAFRTIVPAVLTSRKLELALRRRLSAACPTDPAGSPE